MRNIRQHGRDISLPLHPDLKAQAEMLGYIAAILVLFALLFSLPAQAIQRPRGGSPALMFCIDFRDCSAF
jgi:hypothetical protein